MGDIEVEFRFAVDDENETRGFLDGLEFLGRTRQKDVYFDTRSGEFFKRGVFIRTRNGKTLEFKFNLEDAENRHEDCEEHSFPLPMPADVLERLGKVCKRLGLDAPDVPDAERLMQMNGLGEFVTIDKTRERFREGEFVFCLDDVKGMGKFLEIESMAQQGIDLDGLKKRMAERVKIFRPRFLPTGYIELFVRRKDFDLYKQGRYLLEEDR